MYILACYNITDIPGVLSTEASPCSLNNSSLMWLASRALGVFSTPLLPTTKDIRCPPTSRGLLLCRAALNFSGDDELMSLRNCPGELSRAIKSVFMILFPPIYIPTDYLKFIHQYKGPLYLYIQVIKPLPSNGQVWHSPYFWIKSRNFPSWGSNTRVHWLHSAMFSSRGQFSRHARAASFVWCPRIPVWPFTSKLQ